MSVEIPYPVSIFARLKGKKAYRSIDASPHSRREIIAELQKIQSPGRETSKGGVSNFWLFIESYKKALGQLLDYKSFSPSVLRMLEENHIPNVLFRFIDHDFFKYLMGQVGNDASSTTTRFTWRHEKKGGEFCINLEGNANLTYGSRWQNDSIDIPNWSLYTPIFQSSNEILSNVRDDNTICGTDHERLRRLTIDTKYYAHDAFRGLQLSQLSVSHTVSEGMVLSIELVAQNNDILTGRYRFRYHAKQ